MAIRYILFVCGTRKLTKNQHSYSKYVSSILDELYSINDFSNYELVHGGAMGADILAEEVFIGYFDEIMEVDKCEIVECKADWKKHGNAAGPIRNKKMADYLEKMINDGCKVKCLAFPKISSIKDMLKSGTYNMIAQLSAKNIECKVIPLNIDEELDIKEIKNSGF